MEENHLVSMKKLFKNPDAAAKGTVKDVLKGLKKVLAGDGGTSQFLYKAEFEYSDKKAPMIFIGAPAGDWKKYAKANKTAADFAAGYCKLESDDDGNKKLLFQVKMGKGGKPAMMKSINKELLKKLSIAGEFVDELEVHLDDDDKEDIHGDDTTQHIEDEAKGGELTEIQQAAFDFKAILENYKDVRDNEHDIDEVKDLYKDTIEWGKTIKNLSKEDQAKLKAYIANYKKIVDGLKKVMKADEHIDDELDKVTAIVQKYVEIPDHDSDESKKLVTEAMGSVDKIEKFAKFVGSDGLLEQCTILKQVLAS